MEHERRRSRTFAGCERQEVRSRLESGIAAKLLGLSPMKNNLPNSANATGRRYWRSLDELADTPEFKDWLHREFPSGASELVEDGSSRRHFLKIMSASFALAGVATLGAGCRRPEEHLEPF